MMPGGSVVKPAGRAVRTSGSRGRRRSGRPWLADTALPGLPVLAVCPGCLSWLSGWLAPRCGRAIEGHVQPMHAWRSPHKETCGEGRRLETESAWAMWGDAARVVHGRLQRCFRGGVGMVWRGEARMGKEGERERGREGERERGKEGKRERWREGEGNGEQECASAARSSCGDTDLGENGDPVQVGQAREHVVRDIAGLRPRAGAVGGALRPAAQSAHTRAHRRRRARASPSRRIARASPRKLTAPSPPIMPATADAAMPSCSAQSANCGGRRRGGGGELLASGI